MQIKTTARNKNLAESLGAWHAVKMDFFDFSSEDYGEMTATNMVKIDVRDYQKNNYSPSNVATARHAARLK